MAINDHLKPLITIGCRFIGNIIELNGDIQGEYHWIYIYIYMVKQY